MKTETETQPGIQRLALMLHDAARQILRAFEQKARETDLTLLQWRLLSRLDRGGGVTQAALAGAVEMSPMAVSEALDKLEARGLVRREPDPSDSRAKLVWLTEAAAPSVEQIRAMVQEVYGRALAGIAPEDRTTLMNGLNTIVANLDGPTTQGK